MFIFGLFYGMNMINPSISGGVVFCAAKLAGMKDAGTVTLILQVLRQHLLHEFAKSF